LGHRTAQHREQLTRKPIAVFPRHPKTNKVRFILKNAFHHSTASLRNLQLWIAQEPPGSSLNSPPIGAVGVIAPDRDHLGESLLEVVNHIDHYRQTAEHFSHHWYANHHPQRTIMQLTSHDTLATEVA
jgi:hypothetical protein